MNVDNIFSLITEGQKEYEKPITIEEGWDWGMKAHLRRSFLYLNSQFEDNNEDRKLRPNKNIVLPVLNVQYRTEGFDVKDIELYINNSDEYYKSLLIKKYHEKWAVANGLDTFIDEMTESYCTYGGTLVRKTNEARPEVIDLRNLAFCNQTNVLAYPFAIRHKYSASQLRKANKKWGQEAYGATIDIEGLIALTKKANDKEIEIFEVHGLMPKEWLGDADYNEEDSEDVNQVQIISFYQKEDGQKVGVILFRKREPELPFKFLSRDKVEGRALGRGGVEELFESQVWTNWNEIKITEMLNSASKTIHFSDDPTFKSRNNLGAVENNEVLSVQEGRRIQQIDTYPRNLQVFNDSLERWNQTAQTLGSASEALMGEAPTAGTPFKLYEAQQIEGKGMHKYRQGKLAVFMDEIYRDWILPHLGREIVKEQHFMAELSADEMMEIVDKVMIKKANEFKKKMILSLQDVDEELVVAYKDTIKQEFAKEGNKKFFEILAEEMKDIELSVMTNIAGKQKNLALLTDKVVNVLRQYLASPQIRQDPEMTKLLNIILESSGLSPIMFGMSAQAPQQQGGSAQPMEAMAQGAKQQTNQLAQ
jgi:hypothetical protein